MKLKRVSLQLSWLDGLAVVTWGLVFAISLFILKGSSADYQEFSKPIVACFILYIVAFFGATRSGQFITFKYIQELFYFVQLLSAVGIMLMFPADYTPILTIIWAGMLIHFFSFRTSVVILIAVIIVWFSLYSWRWDKEHVYFTASLYGTFHLFSLLMSRQTQLAEQAREQADQLNRQLLATQHLLTQSTQQHERTRIARELHDLLGHHLTALTINLQVSAHLCASAGNQEAKDKVEQSYALAKLLLSDVREAVSTIKANDGMDLTSAIEMLIKDVPKLTIHYQSSEQVDQVLNIEGLQIANDIIRIIQEAMTNTLRHSSATDFWMTLDLADNNIVLVMYDNGRAPKSLTLGNGLQGISERVNALNGTADFDVSSSFLAISISIPVINLDQGR